MTLTVLNLWEPSQLRLEHLEQGSRRDWREALQLEFLRPGKEFLSHTQSQQPTACKF